MILLFYESIIAINTTDNYFLSEIKESCNHRNINKFMSQSNKILHANLYLTNLIKSEKFVCEIYIRYMMCNYVNSR